MVQEKRSTTIRPMESEAIAPADAFGQHTPMMQQYLVNLALTHCRAEQTIDTTPNIGSKSLHA